MTMRGPAQTSDPVVLTLYQLIDAIGTGRLLIPSLRPNLVWSWGRQFELLQSVKDGIPMGSMMIWRTACHIPWQTVLGGHALLSPSDGPQRQYLLDGAHRLSTIFVALREVNLGDQPTIDVGYDLEEEIFVKSPDTVIRNPILPLRGLFDSLTLLRFQRQLRVDSGHVWSRRADELAMSFREYKVPVIQIASDDLGVATRVLHRTGCQGSRIGEADVVHALTWAPRFNLRDRIESLRSELLQPLNWGNLEFEVVLDVVKLGADLDLQEDSVKEVTAFLKADTNALERAVEHLVRAAELLRDRCGIQSWDLVPYRLQGVLLADALRIMGDRVVPDVLSDWFWFTTYGEMFEGLSEYRIGRAVRELRQTMSDGQLRWSGPLPFQVLKLPLSVDLHSARIKAVALLLARQIKQASPGGSVCTGHDPFATLAAYGSGSLFSLVPRDLLRGPLFASVGNQFLCHPREAADLRKRLLSMQLDERERAAHAIPDAALEAAQRGDWSSFVAERLLEIAALEQGFLGDVLARRPMVGPHRSV